MNETTLVAVGTPIAMDSRRIAGSDYPAYKGIDIVFRAPFRLPEGFSVEWIVAFQMLSRLLTW